MTITSKEVKLQVEDFRVRNSYGQTAADCFAPWYLNVKYHLSDTEAIKQSAEAGSDDGGTRGYDYGVDAYHIVKRMNDAPQLIIIQAKYSLAMTYITKGFKDLEKSIEKIKNMINEVGQDTINENKVIGNLRTDIYKLDDLSKTNLEIIFIVLHLSEEDGSIIFNKTRDAQNRLSSTASDVLGLTCSIMHIGPNEIGERKVVSVPSKEIPLRLKGNPIKVEVPTESFNATMYYGLGYLSEFVDLYKKYRVVLFSKNVRLFINKKKNVVKGPAGKMKETLKSICIDRKKTLDPEVFAHLHNGITISGRKVMITEKGVVVSEPRVLNGCQTITSAFNFRHESRTKDKIETDLWNRILIPIRILDTKDDAIERKVTICNNRQNAITPAALRANDEIQVRLEERLKNHHIFYQRQEGAFEQRRSSRPNAFQDEYSRSKVSPVKMEQLARSILASSGKIRLAIHPNEFFENDKSYNECFSEKNLSSITFLVFLQNLHNVFPSVIKNYLGLERKDEGPRPANLVYYAMCLYVRYLAKDKKLHEIIHEFGYIVYKSSPQLRDLVVKHMGRNSGIKRELKGRFIKLGDSRVETLDEAFSRAESALRLRDNLDPFEVFLDFDDEFDNSENEDE